MALQRGDFGFLLGLAGFFLGGAGAYFGFQAHLRLGEIERLKSHDGEMIETLGSTLKDTRDDLAAANLRISALKKDVDIRTDEIASLRARVGELEKR